MMSSQPQISPRHVGIGLIGCSSVGFIVNFIMIYWQQVYFPKIAVISPALLFIGLDFLIFKRKIPNKRIRITDLSIVQFLALIIGLVIGYFNLRLLQNIL